MKISHRKAIELFLLPHHQMLLFIVFSIFSSLFPSIEFYLYDIISNAFCFFLCWNTSQFTVRYFWTQFTPIDAIMNSFYEWLDHWFTEIRYLCDHNRMYMDENKQLIFDICKKRRYGKFHDSLLLPFFCCTKEQKE